MKVFDRRALGRFAAVLAATLPLLLRATTSVAFVTFESGEVRPLALSPDGSRLFAVDTPDDRLELFAVDATTGNLTHTATVPVGLEPVAVAARTNTEVWVVNHLSDSISIVDLSGPQPRVTRTLLVGDEPRDLVFAGPSGNLAFITTAHRGQNSPVPLADLTTPGIGRADVWVFDATNLGSALGGVPLTVLTMFGDTPRALAVSPDRSTVYAAVFQSGNQTTALSEGVVCNGGSSATACTVKEGGTNVSYPGGLPAPNVDANNVTGPETGLVVKFNPASGHWEDRLARNWDNGVRFFIPDDDVFQIDATKNPPVLKASSPHPGQPFAHVGTVLFNMAVNPATGRVYVSNGDSHNEVRFEGGRPPCTPLTPGGPTPNSVVAHLSEADITVLDPSSGSVTPHHLNPHINYCTVPSPAGTSAASLATPTGLAVTADGRTLYVAAFGSSDPTTPGTGKVGVFSTAALEAGTFTPSAASHIVLSGGGASGLVLNEAHHRLYVLTRFDDALSVVDLTASPGTEVQHLALFNPEPESVVAGRPFLYDAGQTSTNGEAACASCHIFGDFDSLAWDLGDPDGSVLTNPNPFRNPPGAVIDPDFHSLKGPMTTQTLRGMVNDGPMHWRGDRTAGLNPGGNPLDSHGAFERFNVAFVGLNGMPGHCSVTLTQACDDLTPCPSTELCVGLQGADMDAYTDFILQVMLPPNPIRALDQSLTADQQAGQSFFLSSTIKSDAVQPCDGCHVLDPANGHFGTDGLSSFENETQDLKIPHLRNAYQKVGMFGMPAVAGINTGNNGSPGPFSSQSDQVRGFGFLHDGSVDTLFRFHNATVFNVGFNPNGGNATRRQVEQFVLAFDSDLAPVVGQQMTLTSTNTAVAGPRIDLLNQRAAAGECDLTVKGVIKNASTNILEQRGALRLASGQFQTDRVSDPLLSDAQLRGFAATAGQELTYTCVPPGEGVRVGIDRDLDGCPDRSELDAGTDPANPLSVPAVCGGSATTSTTSTTTAATTTTTITTTSLVLIETRSLTLTDNANPAKRKFSFKSSTKNDPSANHIKPPAPGTTGDPTQNGGELIIYNAAGLTSESVSVPLQSGWSAIGTGPNLKWRFKPTDSSSAVSSVVVETDKITVKGGKSGFGYTLNPPPQGSVGVRLLLGSGGWCAAAPAKTSGNPPSTTRNDTVDKFVGEPKSPPPATCPAIPH
jgi:DNA-binding beta-propeller fold protein YncE